MIELDSTDKVMPKGPLKFEVDLAKRIGRHNMVWKAPESIPTVWKEGVPTGNGDFGTLMYGYPENLSFALAKNDIWDCSGLKESRFPKGKFKDFRS